MNQCRTDTTISQVCTCDLVETSFVRGSYNTSAVMELHSLGPRPTTKLETILSQAQGSYRATLRHLAGQFSRSVLTRTP